MKVRRFALWGNLLLSAVLMLAVWVLLVWVASRPALRTLIDLTPQQINSVAPATEELLRELRGQKAEIDFHLFYPPFEGQGATEEKQQEFRIRSRLRELTRVLLVRYQYLGGDTFKLHAHDFYGETQKVREAALEFDYKDAESDVLVVSVRMPGRGKRFRKLSLPLDLGRIERPNMPAAGPLGRQAAQAPPVLRAFKGEEAISSALKSLLVEGVPVAYVLQGYSPDLSDKVEGNPAYGQFFVSLQRSGFDVRGHRLGGEPVPADASLVIVLEPRSEFLDRDADRLFEYVQRGGRVFLNYSWASFSEWNPTGGRFGELVGYELSVAPVFHMIPSGRAGGPGLDGNDAVAKLQLNLNPGHPATRRIFQSGRPIEVAGARGLRERDGAPQSIRREALMWTGPNGWLAFMDAQGFPSLRRPQVQLESFQVAMVCEVDVPTTEGKPPPDGAPKTGAVVIVSGVFCNNAGMPLFGDLAMNICNWMTERRVLLDLQDTGYEAKYLRMQPHQLQSIWSFLVYFVPAAFLCLGLVVKFLRRRQ